MKRVSFLLIVSILLTVNQIYTAALEHIIDYSTGTLYFAVPNNYASVFEKVITPDGRTRSADEYVATGDVLFTENGKYNVIIQGDCAADGIINSADILLLKRCIRGTAALEGNMAAAADGDCDGVLGATDYLRLKLYIMHGIPLKCIPDITDSKYKPLNHNVMKAMWLSQFDLEKVYAYGGQQREINTYAEILDKIFTNMTENGFNTAIVQVRPYADSFYPSDIYTPSEVVTGSYTNEFKYDAFEILLNTAHNHGISVHAWINPLRCIRMSQIPDISTDYLIGKWYGDKTLREKYLFCNKELTGTYYYYLNPAYNEVRQMIISGAKEICTKYNIDGIHMDDYFYPTSNEAFDAEEYALYGNGRTLKQFRYDNINTLVKGLYDGIKEVDSRIIFGISPAGNINNNRDSYFADIDTWGSTDGYVDYLMPQLYWGFDYSWASARFITCADNWRKIITNENVKFYAGLPVSKALEVSRGTNDGTEWEDNKDIIARMIEYSREIGCSGITMYSYKYVFDPVSGTPINEANPERENYVPTLREWSDDSFTW